MVFSEDFVHIVRNANIVLALVACMALLFWLALPNWRDWTVPTRLGWMALFLLCFTGMYGTFEVAYLETYFRVPMVTLSMIWAIAAAVWPRDKPPGSRKK